MLGQGELEAIGAVQKRSARRASMNASASSANESSSMPRSSQEVIVLREHLIDRESRTHRPQDGPQSACPPHRGRYGWMAASPRQAESARAVVWPYMNARRAEGLATWPCSIAEVCAVQMRWGDRRRSRHARQPSTVPAKPSQHLRLSARWAAQMSTYPMPFASTSRPTTRFRSHTTSETWGLTLHGMGVAGNGEWLHLRGQANHGVEGGGDQRAGGPAAPSMRREGGERAHGRRTDASTRSSDVMPAAAKRSYARETLVEPAGSRPSSISSSTR